MDKIQLLQKLSEELSSQFIFEDFKRNISMLQTDDVRLGIMGQPNTAKTTLINSLTGTSLPVSNLPSQINYTISYKEELNTSSPNRGVLQVKNVVVNSDWIKKNKLVIKEINNDIIPGETTAIDLFSLVSQCDVCIYLLSAQSALDRTDLFILDNFNDINMPVLVVLSRLDLLTDEDKDEVFKYVMSNLSKHKNLIVLESNCSIKDSSLAVKNAIDSILKNSDIASIRKNFENFYMTIAIGQLFEVCQNHINDCEEKKVSIDKLANEKLVQLDEKMTEWIRIETNLRQRIFSISEMLRNFLAERKEDIIRRLSHDVDVCGDVKLFWEKDFPFRLEELVRSEMENAIQIVNQELFKVMQWLQDELLKKFKCKISLTTGIVGDRTRGTIQNPDEVSIADTQKLRIVTRIGTAATVIAAGALFATSGIGGVIMAVSMMSGLGAEFFMRKQNNDSKEQIKKHLPDIIERTNLQLITDYESKIQKVTAELISHMQTLKIDWLESSKKTIEQEKTIATFNFNSNKWNSIMGRINQLSELLINNTSVNFYRKIKS